MDNEPAKSIHERLSALEEKSVEQQAHIDALVGVVSDLLAAHAVLHNDVRLCSFVREYLGDAAKREREGGTSRTPASYFAASSGCFARILEETACSQVFDQFWFRSTFWRREERQRRRLRKVSDAIMGKLNDFYAGAR